MAKKTPTKKKRSVIGADPLDAMVPTKGDGRAATKASRRGLEPAGTTKRPEPEPRISKQRLTVHIPVDLAERCKDAVVALSGPPARLTLAELAENALEAELAKLAKTYNKGKTFPKRTADLKGGRPIK